MKLKDLHLLMHATFVDIRISQ